MTIRQPYRGRRPLRGCFPHALALRVEFRDLVLTGERQHDAAITQHLEGAVALKGADGKVPDRFPRAIDDGKSAGRIDGSNPPSGEFFGRQNSWPAECAHLATG